MDQTQQTPEELKKRLAVLAICGQAKSLWRAGLAPSPLYSRIYQVTEMFIRTIAEVPTAAGVVNRQDVLATLFRLFAPWQPNQMYRTHLGRAELGQTEGFSDILVHLG